ncbi:MAG: hypothetical protein ACPGPF_07975 [Pontibacterium sp.]
MSFTITLVCEQDTSRRNLAELIAHFSSCMSDYKAISMGDALALSQHESLWRGWVDTQEFSIKRTVTSNHSEHWLLSNLPSSSALKIADMVRTYLVDRDGTATITDQARCTQLRAFSEFYQNLKHYYSTPYLAMLQRTDDELQISFSGDNRIINIATQSLVLSQGLNNDKNTIYPFKTNTKHTISSQMGDLDDEYNLTVDTKRVLSDLNDKVRHQPISSIGILADLSQHNADDLIYIELASNQDRCSPSALYYSLFPRVKQLDHSELDALTTPGSQTPSKEKTVYCTPKRQYLSVDEYMQARFSQRFPLAPNELDAGLLDSIIQHCQLALTSCAEPTPSRYMAIIMEALEIFEEKDLRIPYDLWKYVYQVIVAR